MLKEGVPFRIEQGETEKIYLVDPDLAKNLVRLFQQKKKEYGGDLLNVRISLTPVDQEAIEIPADEVFLESSDLCGLGFAPSVHPDRVPEPGDLP